MSTIPGYYTMLEAAEVLGISRAQVSRYVSEGRIKAYDLGGQKLIEQEQVHKFEKRPRGNPNFTKKEDSSCN